MSTKIEWTDETWNPVTGCTKVSQGCKNCYAERVFPRAYGRERKFTDVRCHPERLDQPLRWKTARSVFVNSMSDIFHEAVPDDFIKLVLRVCLGSPQHTFQILTKRPKRMLSFMRNTVHCDFFGDSWARRNMAVLRPLLHLMERGWVPSTFVLSNAPNVWLGVSVEDQKTADERIPLLLQTPAAVRFVSYEPALGPVDFEPWLDWSRTHPHLDWIIAGGESGLNASPSHPDWFRQTRDQCLAAGVPFFFKQWGEWCTQGSSQDAADRVWFRSPDERHRLMHKFDDGIEVHRVGKRAAGRLLDGREWNQFPGEPVAMAEASTRTR